MVAAETGSGKTHGYLIPVIQRLNSMQSASKNALDDTKLKKHRHISLVLCPNAILCEQVVRMANTLCDNTGEPILKTAAICGRQVWYGRKLYLVTHPCLIALEFNSQTSHGAQC